MFAWKHFLYDLLIKREKGEMEETQGKRAGLYLNKTLFKVSKGLWGNRKQGRGGRGDIVRDRSQCNHDHAGTVRMLEADLK